MSEMLKKAREWHHDLRQTLVVADVDEETKETVRNYADILKDLIKQVQESEENIEVSQGALSYASTDVLLLKRENKRLREAINQALEKHKWNNEESARILEQALEQSK